MPVGGKMIAGVALALCVLGASAQAGNGGAVRYVGHSGQGSR